jgi:hypothetical protein
MTLFEITDEFMQLLDMMQDPELDPQTVADTMESVQGELEDKADAYVIVMKELEAQKAKWAEEKKRAEKVEATIGNNIKRLKESLMFSMQAIGKTKLETEHFKLGIQKNGGLQPMKITGEVPAEYCKLEPDNEKIREALKTSTLEFAVLEERGVHLSVR